MSKGATIELTKALPTINKSLTIDASSLYENETPGITFDGGNANRIFNVKSDKTVELIKLTLQNGKAGTDESPKNGGAIYNEGNLTLPGVVAKSNSATKNGGAVFNNFGASLTVKGGSIKSNVATKNGGAVANYGTLTIAVEETTISENTASRFGAPISVAERWKLQEARSLSKTKLLRTVPRAARFTTTSTGKT